MDWNVTIQQSLLYIKRPALSRYWHCPHPDGGDDVAGSHDLGLAAAPGVHTEPEQEQVQVLETGEVLTTVKMQ